MRTADYIRCLLCLFPQKSQGLNCHRILSCNAIFGCGKIYSGYSVESKLFMTRTFVLINCRLRHLGYGVDGLWSHGWHWVYITGMQCTGATFSDCHIPLNFQLRRRCTVILYFLGSVPTRGPMQEDGRVFTFFTIIHQSGTECDDCTHEVWTKSPQVATGLRCHQLPNLHSLPFSWHDISWGFCSNGPKTIRI